MSINYTSPALAATGKVGDTVRITYHGGGFLLSDMGATGTIVRFTARGNPVIEFYRRSGSLGLGTYGSGIVQISDIRGGAFLTDENGSIIYE